MNEKLAQATTRINTLGAEYRSGRTQSQAVLRKLKAAIATKVKLQEELRSA
jgi:hypothetical protein